ncbi:MAG: class I SAM-dependent methyltransferase, partial [Rhodocyclaceae bacterium]|nr:class I SAM-dependent methyltransferase [Rhodocyclaceae bacterium]
AGLIARARRHAARRGVQVDWRVGDMREPPAGPPFDGIYCWGDSYGYFDEAGNRAFLDAVWQALRPGGRFALELKLVEEVLLPNFRPRLEGQAGDIRVRILRHYDARTRRLDSRYEYARGTQIELRHASYRIYSCQELCSLLAASGFAQARMLDGQGAVFRPGAEKLRLVATKPRD